MEPTLFHPRSRGDPRAAAETSHRRPAGRSLLSLPCLLLLAGAAGALTTACERGDDPVDNANSEIVRAAESNLTGEWDPVFGQESCSQGPWWIEFSVEDPTTAAMFVEIDDPPNSRVIELDGRYVLWGGHVKFYGGPGGSPVQSGTPIRLLVTQDAAAGGEMAQSQWFEYLVEGPTLSTDGGEEGGGCDPSCGPGSCGADGCGGLCACPDGQVCLPDKTCCEPNALPCGPDGCGGSHGDCACAPSCVGKSCGDDGCGGICGMCAAGEICSAGTCVGGCVAAWSPSWTQEEYSSAWWTEFKVFGGGSLARAVSLEVVDGPTLPLSYGWGKWFGGLPYVPAGTEVILHATDATGATAQTAPFQYLVEPPVTDPCLGAPSTSPGCAPLPFGMLTISMDDSYKSQAQLAAPVMARYGVKATIYHIIQQLEYGDLPYAQALATAGHEVGSHSWSHAFLPQLTPQGIDDELRLSKEYLLAHVGSPSDSFASPLGAYDAAVIAAAKAHYTSHRTVYPGVNYMGSDVYELKADAPSNTTSVNTLCAMFASAAANRAWQILVFHDFTSAPTAAYPLQYAIADFEAALECATETPGLAIVTAREGAAALACASP